MKINSNVIEVYKDATTHYRHLENQRNQYLGFYFTFLPASMALVTTAIKGTKLEDDLFVYIELAFLLNLVVGTLIVSAVKKIGFALNMHGKMIAAVTDAILNEANLSYDEITKPYNRVNPIFNSKTLGTHVAIVNALIFISLTLDTLYVIVMSTMKNFASQWIYLGFGLPFLIVVYLQIKVFSKRVYKKL